METADRVTPILEAISGAVEEKAAFGRAEGGSSPLFWIRADRLEACARALKDAGFTSLENLSAMQVHADEDLIFTYFVRNSASREMVLLRVGVEVKKSGDEWVELPGVSNVWPMAAPFEQEAARLCGVKISGHEIKSEWEGFPLRKSFIPQGMANDERHGTGGGGITL